MKGTSTTTPSAVLHCCIIFVTVFSLYPTLPHHSASSLVGPFPPSLTPFTLPDLAKHHNRQSGTVLCVRVWVCVCVRVIVPLLQPAHYRPHLRVPLLFFESKNGSVYYSFLSFNFASVPAFSSFQCGAVGSTKKKGEKKVKKKGNEEGRNDG